MRYVSCCSDLSKGMVNFVLPMGKSERDNVSQCTSLQQLTSPHYSSSRTCTTAAHIPHYSSSRTWTIAQLNQYLTTAATKVPHYRQLTYSHFLQAAHVMSLSAYASTYLDYDCEKCLRVQPVVSCTCASEYENAVPLLFSDKIPSLISYISSPRDPFSP